MTSIRKNHPQFLLAVLLSAAASSLLAANDTWNGGSTSTGNWSDTANWGGSTVNGGDLLFFGGATRLNNTNDLSGFSFSGITFNSGAGLFSLNGNPFTLSGGITNNSANVPTINNNVTLATGTQNISLTGANLTNNGTISGVDSTSAILYTGSRTLFLMTSNSFQGGVTVTGSGTTTIGLTLGNTNALGTGPLSCNNGSPTLTTVGATPFIIPNAFTTVRDTTFAGNNVIFTGPVTHGSSKQFKVNSGVTVTLDGGLTLGNGANDTLLKSLAGTLVLNGATSGAGTSTTLNGVSYTTSVRLYSFSNGNAGTLVLGNPSALGSGVFLLDAGGTTIMADTDLSGVNAVANSVVLQGVVNAVSIGDTIGGTNNLTFSGPLIVNIGSAGAVTRYLIVTNTGATEFSGPVYLSDGASAGTLSVNVAGTSGSVVFSGAIADGNQPGGSLIMTNAGSVILSGANNYSGPTTINGGQLWVNAQGASQSSTFVVNANDGLVFSNDTAFVLGGLSGSGNVSLLNNLGNPVALTVGNNNASTTYSGMLSDSGGGATLTKTGSGTLTLSGTNQLDGLTTVGHGALVISPNFVGHGNLTVSDGATLGALGNSAMASAQIGTLQIGSSTLQFSGLPAPSEAPITVNTFSPVYAGSGLISVSITSPLNIGTYDLVNYTNYSGSIADFAALTLPAGTVGYLTNNTTASPKAIQLVVTSAALELWTGSVDTNWDFSTYNWNFNNVATNYFDAGPVKFDDTAIQTTVNLVSSVQPSSILVTNSTKNYTFTSSGGFIYGATTLTKNGIGNLAMLNLSNSFTGDVSINGGGVTLSSSVLGGGNINLNSGSLVLNSSVIGNQGAVTLNGGSLQISGGTALTNNITDNANIVSGSGTQSITGSIIGTGTLTQNSNGTLVLSSGNSFGGGTEINSGTIVLTNSTTSLGSGDVTLGDGASTNAATLTFGSAGQIMNNNLIVAPGGTGTYTINGYTNGVAVSQNGGTMVSNTVVVTGSVSFYGVVSGPGTIIANYGSSDLSRFYNVANTWTGSLVLTNNSTFKTVTGSMNSNNIVYVDAGSTLDTFAQSLTIGGLNDGSNGGGTVVPYGDGTVLTLGGNGSYSFSGVINDDSTACQLTKSGSGLQVLLGTNAYNGPTIVSNGTLVVNGSLASGAVNVYGGTLAGTGTLNGPTTVFGGTLSPAGNGVIGTLTISNSLDLLGTLAMDINKTAGTNDLIAGLTSVAYGGTLAVNNLSGTLTVTDSFKLFNAGSYTGSFANITPATPGAGLTWNTNTLITDGILRISSGTASNPTNITVSVSSGQIVITWPADHAGWYLQAQTNALGTGLGTNWVTIPNTGSANSYTNTINPANAAVFYRLSNQP